MSDLTDPPSSYSSTETSIIGAAIILLNGIVGAGIISIPYVFKLCGFLGGPLVILLVAYTMLETSVLIVSVGVRESLVHYEEIAEKLFGVRGFYLAMYAMFMFPFFNMLAYLVIIGDGLPSVFAQLMHDSPPSRTFVIVSLSTFVILPMCLFRYMASLSLTATFSVSSVVIVAFILIIGGPVVASKQGVPLDEGDYSVVKPTFFQGLDILAFVFVNHHGTSLIFRSMKYPSIVNWRRAITFACRAGILLCGMIGIAGYSLFGKYTQGNILNNFDQHDSLISFARVIVSVSVILTYPQDCFVARYCILSIVRRHLAHPIPHPYTDSSISNAGVTSSALNNPLHGDAVSSLNEDAVAQPYQGEFSLIPSHDSAGDAQLLPAAESDDHDQLSPAWHLGVTLALWALTVVVAVLCKDLGVVNTLNGALAGSFIGFILPSAFYLKSHELEIRDSLANILSNNNSILEIVKAIILQQTTALFCVYAILAGLICSVVGLLSVFISSYISS